jgi:hypothetical protein
MVKAPGAARTGEEIKVESLSWIDIEAHAVQLDIA